MIPLDKLQAVRHIVTHENCPDGVASAMILKHVYPKAKVTFCQYDSIPHKTLEPEEGMLFCDFSPYKDRTDAFREAGTIVLDHHKTQKEVVEKFGELGVFADEKVEPGVCGATLAFREVWLPLQMDYDGKLSDVVAGETVKAVETLATLAGIRDTWQKKDPDWRKACEQAEALQFWPVDELLGLAPRHWAQKLELGPVLFERKLRGAQKCIEHSFNFTTGKGRRVVVFEGLRQSSDAAEMLGDKADFVVGFGYNAEENVPSIIYSTRSHTGFDCSTFAMGHGGGGHSAAAGFRLPLTADAPQPYELLKQLMIIYEKVEDAWTQIVGERKKAEDFKPKDEYGALLHKRLKSPHAWF